jgi:hypothetical protein
MKQLIKRRSEDQFDESLLQTIKDINHTFMELRVLLRTFDHQRKCWAWVWFR